MTITVDSACTLDPQVALRPEPFGALAYHYGNRKLIFLRHPDVVAVVKSLSDFATVKDALVANNVAESRWPTFVNALDSLSKSDIVHVR